jgi:CDP-paratose 2-epimerase
MKIALITGSAGLIGSQSSIFFHEKDYKIIGIDNDMRAYFFGDDASTKKSNEQLKKTLKNYIHYNCDIRNYSELEEIFKLYHNDIDIVIHTAAQPSHDWASIEPLTDFSVNAVGTINMLNLVKKYCSNATFIYTSTNKVYGDRPNYHYFHYKKSIKGIQGNLINNEFEIKELNKRFEAYDKNNNLYSINENMSTDNSLHSIFGVSKLSADVMCQEYGKYFDMPTGIFRGGCLTGPNHAGTELHGFLSYLTKCIINNKPYTIFGYNGKQVRDNIHSLDLIKMFWEYHKNPKCGEVYNAGGGRGNDTSIIEAIDKINDIAGTNWNEYTLSDKNRIGDHIWYISDLSKFKKDYPNWNIKISLDETIRQMVEFEKNKL